MRATRTLLHSCSFGFEDLYRVLQNLWERLRNLYHHWGYLLYDWQTRRGVVQSL